MNRSLAVDLGLVAGEGAAELGRGRRRAVQRGEEGLMVDGVEHGVLVRRDGFHRRLVGRVHGEDGIVHPGQRRRLPDRILDARLGPERHALGAAFIDGVGVGQHGVLLVGRSVRRGGVQGKGRRSGI